MRALRMASGRLLSTGFIVAGGTPALLAARSPLPHAEDGLLREGISRLAGEHTDLATMMCVVSHQVSEGADDVRTKALDTSVGAECGVDDCSQRGMAFS